VKWDGFRAIVATEDDLQVRENWDPQPIAVEVREATFFASPSFAPAVS
jgi:hypothetical protein